MADPKDGAGAGVAYGEDSASTRPSTTLNVAKLSDEMSARVTSEKLFKFDVRDFESSLVADIFPPERLSARASAEFSLDQISGHWHDVSRIAKMIKLILSW